VTLHLRAKENPLFPPDGYPSNINRLATYDFASCPTSQPTLISGSGSSDLAVEVECRADLDDPNLTHVVWTIILSEGIAGRLIEWRMGTPFGESHPEAARDDDVRSMRQIAFPVGEDGAIGGDDDCPLANSTIGKTNDPKWWGVG
jgi:hypothetical protein